MYFSGLFHNVSVIEMNMFPLHCSWVSVVFPHVQWCNFLTDIPVQELINTLIIRCIALPINSALIGNIMR